MSAFETLKNLRTELPSGEPEGSVKAKISKPKQLSKTEEERATNDWLESFGESGVTNKNGIRKFVAHTNQPKQQSQFTTSTTLLQVRAAGEPRKSIIKTAADDDELLRLMSE